MSKLLELQTRRGALHEEAAALIPDKGPMTASAKTKFDRLHAEMEDISTEIRRVKAENLEEELRVSVRPPNDPIQGQDLFDRPVVAKGGRENSPEARAFRSYLRSGYNGERFGLPRLAEEERYLLRYESRDMGVGSPTSSIPTSVLVPQGFYRDIESALKYYGPMTEVSKILDTATGAPLPYPTSNDTAQAATIVGEGAQVNEQDVTVSNVTFGAWKLSSGLVKVSLELLQDADFDLENFLKEKFSERFGRGLNSFFTNGTGTSQPTGFMTAATAGPTAVGSSGNTGGSETGATSIGTDDLVALEHSIDPWYRPGAIYQLNDDTLKKLKQIKDKFGRPIYESPQNGQPALLNGYPFRINNDLPTVAANAKTVAFGNFQKYLIRRVKEMSVLRLVERYADYGQVGFIAFARYDANLLDAGTHPIKYLVQAAS